MTRPPGTVGVIAQDTGRFTMFAASLTQLQQPTGTVVEWIIGQKIADNCNRLARGRGEQRGVVGMEGDWLWLLGDDHAFRPDTLECLLDRDVEIVVPLCLGREPPFPPMIFSGWANEDRVFREYVQLRDYPDGGLIEIHSAGTAGMLIRREVFEALADPWFEMGQIADTDMAEDVYFCDKARAAGFTIYADLDLPFGHITSAIVWPQRRERAWSYGLAFPDGLMLSMPPIGGVPTPQKED